MIRLAGLFGKHGFGVVLIPALCTMCTRIQKRKTIGNCTILLMQTVSVLLVPFITLVSKD